jgi:hypothetical protein
LLMIVPDSQLQGNIDWIGLLSHWMISLRI